MLARVALPVIGKRRHNLSKVGGKNGVELFAEIGIALTVYFYRDYFG